MEVLREIRVLTGLQTEKIFFKTVVFQGIKSPGHACVRSNLSRIFCPAVSVITVSPLPRSSLLFHQTLILSKSFHKQIHVRTLSRNLNTRVKATVMETYIHSASVLGLAEGRKKIKRQKDGAALVLPRITNGFHAIVKFDVTRRDINGDTLTKAK